MTEVLVEHHWEPPLTDADMDSMIGSTAGCFGMHRVDRNSSLLSADGRELFCHFTAPDAESVRIALHQACAPRGEVWSGTVHDAPGLTDDGLAQANILVSRRFDAAVAFEEIQALDDVGSSRFLTHRARRMRTYFSTNRRRMVCLYHAPDAESVRIALREARMPVERVWAFRQFRS
jgi:Nickel responsive protein SCO4226-like